MPMAEPEQALAVATRVMPVAHMVPAAHMVRVRMAVIRAARPARVPTADTLVVTALVPRAVAMLVVPMALVRKAAPTQAALTALAHRVAPTQAVPTLVAAMRVVPTPPARATLHARSTPVAPQVTVLADTAMVRVATAAAAPLRPLSRSLLRSSLSAVGSSAAAVAAVVASRLSAVAAAAASAAASSAASSVAAAPAAAAS